MSWAEVKKINSDLTTPLNIAALINHIDLIGDSYIGCNDSVLLKELVKADSLYDHSIASFIVGTVSLSTESLANSCGYIWLCKTASISYSTFSSLDDVVGDSTAFNALRANSTTLTAMVSNTGAMLVIGNNLTAMSVVVSDSIMCNAIAGSSVAISALDNTSPVLVPTMTANNAPSGLASTDAAYDVNTVAYKAFDGTAATSWLASSGAHWLRYDFTSAVWCYRMAFSNDGPYEVKDLQIQYSDNGTTWTTAKSYTAVQGTSSFNIPVATPNGRHSYWRVNFSASYNVGGWPTAKTLQFYCK